MASQEREGFLSDDEDFGDLELDHMGKVLEQREILEEEKKEINKLKIAGMHVHRVKAKKQRLSPIVLLRRYQDGRRKIMRLLGFGDVLDSFLHIEEGPDQLGGGGVAHAGPARNARNRRAARDPLTDEEEDHKDVKPKREGDVKPKGEPVHRGAGTKPKSEAGTSGSAADRPVKAQAVAPAAPVAPASTLTNFNWAAFDDEDEDTPDAAPAVVKPEEPVIEAAPTATQAPARTQAHWLMPDDDEDDIVYPPLAPSVPSASSAPQPAAPTPVLNVEISNARRPDFDVTPQQLAAPPLVLDTDPYCKVSDPLNWFLREYQREGVRFLYKCYKQNRGGILADDMGLGKTIQVIAFLGAIMNRSGYEAEDQQKRITLLRQLDKDEFKERVKDWPRALIACPATLRDNWVNEINKWSYLSVGVLGSSAKSNKEVLQEYRAGQHDLLLAGLEHIREHIDEYKEYEFNAIVVDEAHRIKNSESTLHTSLSQLKCKVRLALTGTPFLNGYGELWELLRWIDPEQFPDLKAWKMDIATPIEVGQTVDATPIQIEAARVVATRLVTKLLPPYMIRRTKELLKDILPEKADYVVVCAMTEQQHRWYRRVWAEPELQAIIHSSEPCPCGRRNRAGQRVKRRQCHDRPFFSLLKFHEDGQTESGPSQDYHDLEEPPAYAEWRRLEDDEAKEKGQPVERRERYEDPTMGVEPMKYEHLFLSIANHLALAFPDKKEELSPIPYLRERYKRQMASLQNLYPKDWQIRMQQCDVFSDDEYCGKWRVLRSLLEAWRKEGDAKVLIFSRSLRLLNFIEAYIDKEAYPFRRLDGSTPQHKRQPYVDEFNNDPSVFIFLISTAAGGVGLNLTGANKVIIFDPSWTPALDMQAMDRAHRSGQKRKVEVFRLLSQGSVEERIYERQLYKMTHANIALEGKVEQRLFRAHQGVPRVPTDDEEGKGELFGWANLFEYMPDQRVGHIIEDAKRINGVEDAAILDDKLTSDVRLDAVENEVDLAWMTAASQSDDAPGHGKQRAAPQKNAALSAELDTILSQSTIGFYHKTGDLIGRGGKLERVDDAKDPETIKAFWNERWELTRIEAERKGETSHHYMASRRNGALPRAAESSQSLAAFESMPQDDDDDDRKDVKKVKLDGDGPAEQHRSRGRPKGSKNVKKEEPAPIWPPPRART